MKYIILLALLFTSPAIAQSEAPKCNSENAGILACMAGKSCMCKLFPPSRMTPEIGGFRWDCGITRPDCPDRDPEDIFIQNPPYEGPAAVGIDESVEENTTIINN